ncbi:MAG: zinc-dependent alcohol dehydrogenase family protein [Pseudomonadota bacterium]
MLAMTLSKLGTDQAFEAVDIELPSRGAGEIVIDIHAASINVVDTKIRGGMDAIAPDAPIILGCDVAGVVTQVGPGAGRFEVGDEVYGCAGGVKGSAGTYADAMIADERLLAHKPKTLSFLEAAAVPLVGITAWEALVDRAKVEPGEQVLVHGGTGGVGHFGLQLAKALGAVVHTTVSTARKSEIADRLGADRMINYREKSVHDYIETQTDGRGYDVVFDTVGGDNIAPSLEALANHGRAVSIVSLETSPDLSALHLKNASLHVVFMLLPLLTGEGRERHGRILERLAIMIDRGLIKPLLDEERFTLDEVGQAHERLTSGAAIGKIVVEVPR